MAKPTEYLDWEGLRELWREIPDCRAAWVRTYLADKLRQGLCKVRRALWPIAAMTLVAFGLNLLAYSLGGSFARGVVDASAGWQLQIQIEVK